MTLDHHITPPKDALFVEASQVLERLQNAGHQAYFVGGSVRDLLLGREMADYDVATSALPEAVMAIFKETHFKYYPTGIAHGTVSLVGRKGRYEVTAFREDVRTDGRRAQVQFGHSLEKDARRRDFTLNALYMDQTGKIIDLVGGLNDLRAKKLRFVGLAQQRIDEDFLRALRLLRFWSQLGFTPLKAEQKAVQDSMKKLKHLSRERIIQEVRKLLQGEYPSKPLRFLLANDLPFHLWRKRRKTTSKETTAFLARFLKLPPKMRVEAFFLFLCLPQTRGKAEDFLRDAKLSLAERQHILAMKKLLHQLSARKLPPPALVMEWIDDAEKDELPGYVQESFLPVCQVFCAQSPARENIKSIQKMESRYQWLRLETQRIDAHILMQAKGLKPGPALGRAIIQERRKLRTLGLTPK